MLLNALVSGGPYPPGRPVKRLLLVATVLFIQCAVPVSFILPPATVNPPKKLVNDVHSLSDGMCHHCVAKPLWSLIAY